MDGRRETDEISFYLFKSMYTFTSFMFQFIKVVIYESDRKYDDAVGTAVIQVSQLASSGHLELNVVEGDGQIQFVGKNLYQLMFY